MSIKFEMCIFCSCQFGARGFTKEMRQIAGGSQSGLKKFLSQYPSLFAIDGDFVYISAFSSSPSEAESPNSSLKFSDKNHRDYAAEAVEYFREKLLQYGEGIEVPIKSLLGHRSQASPEVRHISGQHIKEFYDFLCKFPDAFVVRDENVILKEYEHLESQMYQELETVQVDEQLTSKLIEFFIHCIDIKGPLLVEQMFHAVSSNFPEGTWSSMFKTPQDLATFIKMYSDVFHVQANLITLLNPGKAPKLLKERTNNSTAAKPVGLLATPLPPLADTDIVEPPIINSPRQSLPGSPTHAQSLKQRINSLVVQTLAHNSTRERSSLPPGSGGSDQWGSHVMSATKLVNGVREGQFIVDSLLNETVLAVDLEGVNLGVNGRATLLQIATMAGQVFIFDLLTYPDMITSTNLAAIFTSDHIVKVNIYFLFLRRSVFYRIWEGLSS